MPLSYGGLVKLLEETGELHAALGNLQQTAAKKVAYFDTDEHPDGAGSLTERLEDEIADVTAILSVVQSTLNLNHIRIAERVDAKILTFMKYHKEEL